MSVKDRSTLKTYFIAGAIPTQAQFADFIDSTRLKSENVDISSVTYGVNTLAIVGGVATWDIAAGGQGKLTLTGNTTLAFLNAKPGQFYILQLVIGGAGSYTLTPPAGSKVANAGGGLLPISAAVGCIDLITVYYDGTTFFFTTNRNYT